MPRKLQIWNGRGDFSFDGLNGHIFVAATTKKQAVDLVNKAGYSCGRFNLRELNGYYNESCWGRDLNGITPEVGVWFQHKDDSTKPCDCFAPLELNKPHRADCPRKPRRLV